MIIETWAHFFMLHFSVVWDLGFWSLFKILEWKSHRISHLRTFNTQIHSTLFLVHWIIPRKIPDVINSFLRDLFHWDCLLLCTSHSGKNRTKQKAEENGLAFEKPWLLRIMEFGHSPETSRWSSSAYLSYKWDNCIWQIWKYMLSITW